MLTITSPLALWSFKQELLYVGMAFVIVLLLPLAGVVVLTTTGINVVSEALIEADTQTNHIEIKNPLDGTVVTTINKPYVWPVAGVITLEFGESSGYQLFHTGIDIANPNGRVGDPIKAFMDGKVTHTGETQLGYGKHIIIDHGDNINTVYAHLDRIFVVKEQEVVFGQVIGREGSTGWSTGTHLHFEIRVYGIPINPRTFLH